MKTKQNTRQDVDMKPPEGLILTWHQMGIKDSFSPITLTLLSLAKFSYILKWAQWTHKLISSSVNAHSVNQWHTLTRTNTVKVGGLGFISSNAASELRDFDASLKFKENLE